MLLPFEILHRLFMRVLYDGRYRQRSLRVRQVPHYYFACPIHYSGACILWRHVFEKILQHHKLLPTDKWSRRNQRRHQRMVANARQARCVVQYEVRIFRSKCPTKDVPTLHCIAYVNVYVTTDCSIQSFVSCTSSTPLLESRTILARHFDRTKLLSCCP